MTSTVFTDGASIIYSSWLNDVNAGVYAGSFPGVTGSFASLRATTSVSVGAPTATAAAVNVQQVANGAQTLFLQRNTDSASTGNLLEGWNAALNFQLFKFDTFGNLTANAFYSQNPSTQPNSVINIKQAVNGSPAVVIQRNTDSSPSGDILQVVNTANNNVLVHIDVVGNVATSGVLFGSTTTLTGAAAAVSAGQISIGATTATSATAGANGAPPAQVVGYIIINVAGTQRKIPYYAN